MLQYGPRSSARLLVRRKARRPDTISAAAIDSPGNAARGSPSTSISTAAGRLTPSSILAGMSDNVQMGVAERAVRRQRDGRFPAEHLLAQEPRVHRPEREPRAAGRDEQAGPISNRS